MKQLVTKIEELQQFLNLFDSYDINDLLPYIRIAERKYVKEAMGKEMYAELLTAYTNSVKDDDAVALTDDLQELWEFSADAIAHLALLEGADTLNINFGAGGFTRKETTNQKSAYQYQVLAFKRSRKDQGFYALSELIRFLDEKEDTFTTYKNSDTRKAFKEAFISDVKTFSKYVDISDSRWTFQKLQPIMDELTNKRIKAVLGEDRFTTIKAELLTALSEENEALMNDFIQPAIAHLTWAEGIEKLSVNVDDRGVTIYNTESARDTIDTFKDASINRLKSLSSSHLQSGLSYLKELEEKVAALDGTETSTSTAILHTDEDDAAVANFT